MIFSPTTVQTTAAATTSPTTVPSTTTTRAPAIPAFLCNAHLAFAVDISLTLSADQFTSMRNMILDPFLSVIYPNSITPSPWVSYAASAYPVRPPQNVSSIISFISALKQGTAARGLVK